MFSKLLGELLHLKELTGVLVLFFGLGLSLAAFIVEPTGIIDNSILWIVGQCFLYCGSIFCIDTHYATKQKELEHDLKLKMKNLQ